MADIQVTNTDSDLSGNTLLTEEEAYTITGLHTYNRSTNPPFAVASGAAKVDNLDADKLDGQTGTYYLAAANATGTLSVAQGGTGATSLTDGGLLLGSGTGAVTALGVAANGQIPIGDGSGDPQLATISGTSNQIDVTNGAASITLSLSSSYVGQTSITTLGTIATGTWQGSNIGVPYGGTGNNSFTDNTLLMGNGTSALSLVTGVYGSDSAAILKIEGAAATLQLTETATDPDESWQLKTLEASGDSYLQLQRPSGGTALSFHKNGYQVAYADGVNAYYYNAAGSTEHLRFGSSGISFDGGTDNLGRYDEGTFTPYYKEVSTATGQVAGTGKYLKIGDMITIHMDFTNVTTGASGATSSGVIGGIPDIETSGGIGAPATHTLPLSGATNVFYLSGSVAYFYAINNNSGWGAENFRNSQAGIYLRTNHTYKIA